MTYIIEIMIKHRSSFKILTFIRLRNFPIVEIKYQIIDQLYDTVCIYIEKG